jgi:hypothetical protein
MLSANAIHRVAAREQTLADNLPSSLTLTRVWFRGGRGKVRSPLS